MDPTAPSEEIDRAVRAVVAGGGPVYEIHNTMVAKLAPDIILTQDQCRICAVTKADVTSACSELPGVTIVTIEPTKLDDVLGDVRTIAGALGVPERGERLVRSMEHRLGEVRLMTEGLPRKTACHLEWLAPIMGSGYWIAELLDFANCEMVHGTRGGHCPTLTDLAALDEADVLLLAPCGFSIQRTRYELSSLGLLDKWKDVRAVRDGRCFVADGDRFFNRSSCEIIESAEMAAEMAHPELCGLWGHHGRNWCRLDELDAFCDITPPEPAGMPPTANTSSSTLPLPAAESEELEGSALAVVGAQLRALRASDFDEAFRLCTPLNQERLASAEHFATICNGSSFSVLVGETTVAQAGSVDIHTECAVTVRVSAGDSRFRFDLAKGEDGWRTDGVRVVC